jgi:hypothetical protein
MKLKVALRCGSRRSVVGNLAVGCALMPPSKFHLMQHSVEMAATSAMVSFSEAYPWEQMLFSDDPPARTQPADRKTLLPWVGF